VRQLVQILDKGHIYQLIIPGTSETYTLKFVKRSGGAVTYVVEWPGLQTQAVMRALIDFLSFSHEHGSEPRTFDLWQLGCAETHPLTVASITQVSQILAVLINRSEYLNSILMCLETFDACTWMICAQGSLRDDTLSYSERCDEAAHFIRKALWCYEARAYRRKQENVNRKNPLHDDTMRPKSWRPLICEDVPFNDDNIEQLPIGDDGHIIFNQR
jgi:hypothetical protein